MPAMLGDVVLDVVREERPQYRNEITEHAVEDGEEIADHVRRRPRTLSISATIAGADWEQRYERLKQLAEGEDLVDYVGAEVMRNVVVESFDPSRTVEVANGVRFDITLRQVRVARVEERLFLAPDPVTQVVPEADSVDRGLQQPEETQVDEETGASWLVASLQGIGVLGGVG